MDKLIFRTVERLVKKGSLRITTARGATRSFGDGNPPAIAIRFRNAAAQRRVLTDPELKLGQAFVDGDLVLEDGTIIELLQLLLSQDVTQLPASSRMLAGLRFILRRFGQLLDYRDVPGRFDRIVSVGMFEHVGLDHYDRFFRKCRELLDDDGVMVLDSIGRSDPPGFTNPWIAKYIFPGGYISALSDERFVRLWEYYLSVSELAFRYQGMMVFQIQLARMLFRLHGPTSRAKKPACVIALPISGAWRAIARPGKRSPRRR